MTPWPHSTDNSLPTTALIRYVRNFSQNLKQQPAYGTDLLRVWVASVDSTRDVLIGPAILAQTSDALRKIRNTARFMLGNLHGQAAERFAPAELGLVERFMMHELFGFDRAARVGYNAFAFNKGESRWPCGE